MCDIINYKLIKGDVNMSVRISKVQDGIWDVIVGGKVISKARRSFMYGGSYEVELPNGKIVNAVSQDALKCMVAKHL